MTIIGVLTLGTIASAVSGVAGGIRWLSNIDMALALVLTVFIFVVGPTVFLMNIIPGGITEYFGTLPDMLGAYMSEGEDMQTILSSWTTFYWAWWVSWAPFVGMFTAKISRGRTIRQFVLGVLLIPSSIIVLAVAVLGGSAIWLQRRASELDAVGNTVGIADPDRAIAPDGTIESLPAPEEIPGQRVRHRRRVRLHRARGHRVIRPHRRGRQPDRLRLRAGRLPRRRREPAARR